MSRIFPDPNAERRRYEAIAAVLRDFAAYERKPRRPDQLHHHASCEGGCGALVWGRGLCPECLDLAAGACMLVRIRK